MPWIRVCQFSSEVLAIRLLLCSVDLDGLRRTIVPREGLVYLDDR